MSSSGFSNASESLEEEWHEEGYRAGSTAKNTIAGRIDPKIAERLNAFVRGNREL